MQTVGEVFSFFRRKLSEIYEPGEAEQVAILIFEHVFSYRRMEIFMNEANVLEKEKLAILENLLSETMSGKPIQYVIGTAWFCGMKLTVNENVLIPRRETEELVHWILNDIKISGKIPSLIIDFCTGSGCIAIALKKELKNTRIIAVDNSEPALAVAKANAFNEALEIEFIQSDVIHTSLDFSPDKIVSNPPYVLNSERIKMHNRVIRYEPESALFVPDDDALIFYRHIADWGKKHLLSAGKIYFEINEQMGKQVSDLHLHLGYSLPVIRKDLQEKDRMFRAIVP